LAAWRSSDAGNGGCTANDAGILNASSPETNLERLNAFHLGLAGPTAVTRFRSISPKAPDSSGFADLHGDPCGIATQALDRIVWLPSLRPWFALHS